ncbi:MAG: hypothetical protein LBR84_07040 [Tannerella sp.]|jgi:hypothetical protein|nr:hypothetical protein [Tannerella sp.]
MKRYIFVLAALILAIACNDISHSPLDGKWQLKTVEKNGVTTAVDTVWYNFQSSSVFSLQIYVLQWDSVLNLYGLKTQTDNVIDINLIEEAYLDMIDWNGTNRRFTIDMIEGDKLKLLSAEGYNYSFIKF